MQKEQLKLHLGRVEKSLLAAELGFDHGSASRYVEMIKAFARTGGTMGGDELAQRMRSRLDQPVSKLARWIVRREVVSFRWQLHTVVPLFQFDQSIRPHPGIQPVVAELSAAFDDWEVAEWFALPNCWLSGVAPADAFAGDWHEVHRAARADRFIAMG
jgi:hypothetical protein